MTNRHHIMTIRLHSLLFILALCIALPLHGFGQESKALDKKHLSPKIAYSGRNTLFEVGTTWTYEVNFWVYDLIFAKTFRITGIYTDRHGDEFYVVQFPNRDTRLMYDEDGKWYFQRSQTDSFNLLVDFNARDSFHFKTHDYCGGWEPDVYEGVAKVDSTETIVLPDSSSAQLMHLSYSLRDSIGDTRYRDAIRGIGFLPTNGKYFIGDNPFTTGLLWTTCDPGTEILKLRCFYNKGKWLHFVDYDCDSSWFDVATKGPTGVSSFYHLRPNPLRDRLYIDLTDAAAYPVRIDVQSIEGTPVLSTILMQENNEINTTAWPPGSYVIRLRDNRGRSFSNKLIRVP